MDPFDKLKDVRTLLVDDDGLIRESLSMAFLSRGCNIRAVESAEKGIVALQKERFDVIISDFKLPGMNGMEFFKNTTASQAGSGNVLIAGNVQENELKEKNNPGIHEFVQKPFTVMALVGTLARLLENGEKSLED